MSDQVNKAHQATPAATLEQQIMDPNFPKNEREWWAAARIEQLEEANELMLTDIRRTDVDMLAFKARIEQLEAALRPFACKCSVKGMGAGGNCTRGTGECDCWNARAALEASDDQ